MNLYYAFTDWNGLSSEVNFVGLSNFAEIFQDVRFKSALIFTLKYTVIYVLLINVVALVLAMALVQKFKGSSFFRAAIYVSNIVSAIIVGYMWRFIFTIACKSVAEMTGIPFFAQSFLGNAQNAFWVLIIVAVWKSTGFYMLLYISGYVSIPDELHEVALLDGARGLVKFWRITLPMMMYSVTIALFYSITEAFRSFEVILVLTNGGPGFATRNLAFNIYTEAFKNNRFGYGTAQAVLFFLMIGTVTILQVRMTQKSEVKA